MTNPCRQTPLQRFHGTFLALAMVARGRFELPSMGLFLVRESKAHHWPGHCFRPLLVHYTTGLQETRVFGQDPISLLRYGCEVVDCSQLFGQEKKQTVFRNPEQ